jgi:hypothetical protein
MKIDIYMDMNQDMDMYVEMDTGKVINAQH